jgi:predicted HTH domain antitoxin
MTLLHCDSVRSLAQGGPTAGLTSDKESNLSEEAARLLALELYREDKVSLGRAAELCHMPLAAFMDFAAKHGVAPLRYSFEDLEEERQSADRLKA